MDTPAIGLGAITIHDPGVTFGDLYIFKQWRLTSEPAILIGMDTLGLLDTLDHRLSPTRVAAAHVERELAVGTQSI